MTATTTIQVGTRITLATYDGDHGALGTVYRVNEDDSLDINFDDGDEGCYDRNEVEVAE